MRRNARLINQGISGAGYFQEPVAGNTLHIRSKKPECKTHTAYGIFNRIWRHFKPTEYIYLYI